MKMTPTLFWRTSRIRNQRKFQVGGWFAPRVSVASRMWGRAAVLLLVLVVSAVTPNISNDQLKIGRAINIFGRLGYLSISMRVVPRNDSDMSWVFREPTVDVFTGIDHLVIKPSKHKLQKAVLDRDFHMEFCDNLRQLLQAYFRDFKFENLEKPWRAFTGSWVPELMARNLGINSSFVNGDYCYVLVRLSRYHDNVRMQPLNAPVNLEQDVAREIERIRIGNASHVLTFIKKFGSHYITSYITGNSLYQVFVYNKTNYYSIKERLKSRGIQNIKTEELTNYFSPWYAEHVGRIRTASGNKSVEQWAERNLRFQYFIFSFPSLLRLHSDPTFIHPLDKLLLNEALLQIDLRTLAPAFKDPAKRKWFLEVMDNHHKLWEVNM